MALYQLSDLTKADQAEINRILAIPSGQRSATEANFLIARASYLDTDSATRPPNQFATVETGDFLVTVATDGSGNYNCNGTADEVQINAAIAAVNAAGGGIVHLKSGTYVCAANVSLDTVSNMIFEGSGHGTILTFSVNGTKLRLNNVSGVKVRDLKIDSSSQSGQNFYQAMSISGTNVEAYGLDILTHGFGIFTSSTQAILTENIWIRNNRIRGNCVNDLIGGGPADDTSVDCRNVIVRDNFLYQDSTRPNAGTYYTSIDMVGVKSVQMLNNHSWGDISFGWERDPNEYSELSGNIVKRYVGYVGTPNAASILINDNANTGDVSGTLKILGNTTVDGWIYCNGKSGQSMNGVIIANNIIKHVLTVASPGIRVEYCDKALIIGNHAVAQGANTQEGISSYNSTGTRVIGNYVDGFNVGLQVSGTSNDNTWTNNDVVNSITAAVGTSLISASGAIVDANRGINPDNLVYAQGNVTGATSFDRFNGDVIAATLTGNITVTLTTTRVPRGSKLTLVLTQDATGSRTVTWPSNFKKAGGSLTLSTGTGAVDVIKMEFDGTNYREVSRSLNQS